MPLLLRLTDARKAEVTGPCLITYTVITGAGAQAPVTSAHVAPKPFTLPLDPAWQRADVRIEHDDYQPQVLSLRREGSAVEWSDPSTVTDLQGGDQGLLNVPLSRIRYAPGQVPPYGAPTGDERGVYVAQKQGQPQIYAGLVYQMLPIDGLRLLKDRGSTPPSCLVDPMPVADEGWQRLGFDEHRVEPAKEGGFVWLEYGSPASRPHLPRFLVAVWVPQPAAAVTGNAVDMLAFFSPSTANSIYPKSTYPFRDKYPYTALGQATVDPETKETHDAKVQPYALLGYKYLFRPTVLVPISIAAGKPLVMVMPIFPNAGGAQQGQPFNSKAGLYRLLLEVRQFLEREGYNGSSFELDRLNGRIAPTAGDARPPPPAFSRVNRPRLAIRTVVVCGYSRASVPVEQFLRTDAISASATDYPPALYGADPVEFDAQWQELWDLDFYLDEKDTKIPRARYEMALRQWLGRRDTRRLRICHSSYTLKGVSPDAYFPQLRSLLTAAPSAVRDPALAARWASDWRDPAARWSALFLSDAFLRAKQAAPVLPTKQAAPVLPTPVLPTFPLVTDPVPAIHGFTAQLAFGLASRLRTLP